MKCIRMIAFGAFVVASIPAHSLFIELLPAGKRQPADLVVSRALTQFARGDISGAKTSLQAILDQDPKLTSALLGMADIAHHEGRDDAVRDFLTQALDASPDNAAVQTAFGRYLYLGRDFSNAKTHFERAIKLDPTLPDPVIELASLHVTQLKDPGRAAELYAQAIALKPEDPKLRFARAAVLSTVDRLPEAIEELDAAQGLTPNKADVLHLRGTMLASHGKSEQAIEAFDQALSLAPQSLQTHWAKAEVLMGSGQHVDAERAYKDLLRLDPQHAPALTRLGFLYQIDGRSELAEDSYKKALAIDPTIAVAYNNLAFAAAGDRSRSTEALAWAEKAVALQPDNPEFKDTLAQAYISAGEFGTALSLLEDIVKKYPGFDAAAARLEEVRRMLTARDG